MREMEERSKLVDSEEQKKAAEEPHAFTLHSFLVFILLGAIWGSAFTFIKFADEDFPPFSLVSLRLLTGGFSMFLVTRIAMCNSVSLTKEVRRDFSWRLLPKLAFMGFFNNFVPFSLVAYSENNINSGVASVLDSSIPLFGLIFAHWFLANEKMTQAKVLGLGVGFAGVIMVCLQSISGDEVFGLDELSGYLMVTGAAASYAIASVFARKHLSRLPALPVATGQILFGALFSVLCAFAVDFKFPNQDFGKNFGFLHTATLRGWLSILYLGLISTVVAYMCYFYLIRTVGSVKQTLVGYLLPVFGVFEGAIFLGDWDGVAPWYIISEVLGAVLICSGIFLVNLKKKKLSKGDGVVNSNVDGVEEGEGRKLIDEDVEYSDYQAIPVSQEHLNSLFYAHTSSQDQFSTI